MTPGSPKSQVLTPRTLYPQPQKLESEKQDDDRPENANSASKEQLDKSRSHDADSAGLRVGAGASRGPDLKDDSHLAGGILVLGFAAQGASDMQAV